MDQQQVIEDWIATNLGGRVISFTQQPRWRPMWPIDVEVDGQVLQLIVRGTRVDTPLVFPLDHEMRFQQKMHEHGLPACKVYGWIDALPAYVMDRVDGSPDMSKLTGAHKRDLTRDYMGVLARLHQLDPAEFAAAGIQRAARPEDSGYLGLAAFERLYRSQKKIPDPLMEFVLGWLRRHPLPPHTREAPIVWDSGQFHQKDGRLVAVLDVELGHVGDPLMDLAAFRMRDTVLHYGDLDQMYADYVAAGGFELDWTALQLHHIGFTLTNMLSFHAALADPPPGSDYMTNLQWCCETNLHAIEAVAEAVGIELPHVQIPEVHPSNVAVRHAHQTRTLGSVETDDPYLKYKLRGAFRLQRHLQRVDEIGAAMAEADLDDLQALLGYRPTDPLAGAAALEQFVLDDDGTHDDELVLLLHRRHTREHASLGPAGSSMATHHLVTPFPKVGV